MRFLRLEEEYWFRAVFLFLRLEEEYWFRMVFLVLVFFRPFDLGHFHWKRFIGGRDIVSHIIHTFIHRSFIHTFICN